jgi:hypothetical protein
MVIVTIKSIMRSVVMQNVVAPFILLAILQKIHQLNQNKQSQLAICLLVMFLHFFSIIRGVS